MLCTDEMFCCLIRVQIYEARIFAVEISIFTKANHAKNLYVFR